MQAEPESNDWTELREFSGVDLLSSYVLSWALDGSALTIDIDVCLQANHPFYEPPRPSEKACIRPGTLEFPYCDALRTGGATSSTPLSDMVAQLGHGKVRSLRRVGDGKYQLNGEFGSVHIESERPILRLNDSVY